MSRVRRHDAGVWNGTGFQCGKELPELGLKWRGVHALVVGNEVRDGSLCLKGAESLGKRLVVDGGEEEGGFELAGLHVTEEGVEIGCAGIAGAVAPDGVEMLRDGRSQCR